MPAQVPPLGLDHRELVVAVGQHIVGDVLGGSHARTLQAAEGDDLAPHPAGLHHAPAGSFQGRVDQFGAGLGLVHSAASLSAAESREVDSPANAFRRTDCLRLATASRLR